jgi:hypothetical protein
VSLQAVSLADTASQRIDEKEDLYMSFDPYGKTVRLRPYVPPPRTSSMPWWVIPILVVFLILCALGLLVGYLLVSAVSGAGSVLFAHTGAPAGSRVHIPAFGGKQPRSASAVANDFMMGLKNQDYLRSYNNFDVTVLVLETPEDFERQVRHADTCYGAITQYQVVAHMEAQEEAHITYRISRKFSRPYSFQLVLLQDDAGNWAITSYGNNGQLSPPGILACA